MLFCSFYKILVSTLCASRMEASSQCENISRLSSSGSIRSSGVSFLSTSWRKWLNVMAALAEMLRLSVRPHMGMTMRTSALSMAHRDNPTFSAPKTTATGHLLVFKQAVGIFNIYIRQNAQYQRSR